VGCQDVEGRPVREEVLRAALEKSAVAEVGHYLVARGHPGPPFAPNAAGKAPPVRSVPRRDRRRGSLGGWRGGAGPGGCDRRYRRRPRERIVLPVRCQPGRRVRNPLPVPGHPGARYGGGGVERGEVLV